MFSTNFRSNTTKTGKCVKVLSKLPITENRIEKLLLVRFSLPLLFRQMVKKLLVLFGSNCNISICTQHYELKFCMRTKFNTLISTHIYRFSVTSYFLFGRYFNCGILFHNLCQKSKIFERWLKNGTVFVKKASIMLMTSSEQEKHLLIEIQLFSQKQQDHEEAVPILI